MSDSGTLICVVDDDASVREGVASLIRSAGMTARTFASGEEFLAAPRSGAPGCLVLDVSLPGLSGLQVQQALAGSGVQVPIIFLTGHGDIPMTVRALKAGAVNFLTKPFEDEDLLSAIRQCIRIKPAPARQTSLPDRSKRPGAVTARSAFACAGARVFHPFRLDSVNQCLWRLGEAAPDERVSLTPKAFAVLTFLVDNAGRLVTQEELLDAVWPDTFVQPEVLKYQIADIRGILGDSPKKPAFIETLPRRGYRFVAAVLDEEQPEPPTPSCTAPVRVVGRTRELGELRTCFEKALRGERQIVFITGEPGIGKTALVDEFQRQCASEQPSLRILRGQCVEGYGGTEPYYPILEAMGQLCRGANGQRAVEILGAHAPTWLVQFPSLMNREQRQVLQQEIMGATRDRMLREAREALDTLSLEGPQLWIFEDMQWADPSTIDLLSATARRQSTARAMVIITKRPAGLAPSHPLRALKSELVTHRLCREINLGPLSQSDVVDYLARESDGCLPDRFAELIYHHTEGNPLFMIAALDHMAEHGFITRQGGKWQLQVPPEEVDFGVPETLRQMIEAHIDHLTSEEQRVLEVASVAGARFSTSPLAAVLQQDPRCVEQILANLSRRSLIVRSVDFGRAPDANGTQLFEFVHTLYREVFCRRLTPLHRAWIRQRAQGQAYRVREVAESEVGELEAPGSDDPTPESGDRGSITRAARAFA